jgi:plasmid stabilization system protein ParE
MAKRKIIWSPDANLDMLNILEYFYKRNGTKTYGKKIYFKIRKSVRLLSKHPFLGIQTDDENIRNLIEGDYAIFYKLDDETIYILSIWDCRQDPEALIFQK